MNSSRAKLAVGDDVPPLTLPPISRTVLALFSGASGDHNPIHIDIDFAKAAGLPDVFGQGMLTMAYVGRMLTDWLPQSALRKFSVRFGSIAHLENCISCTGTVVEEFTADGEQRLRVRVQAADQHGDVKLAGEAVVAIENNGQPK